MDTQDFATSEALFKDFLSLIRCPGPLLHRASVDHKGGCHIIALDLYSQNLCNFNYYSLKVVLT